MYENLLPIGSVVLLAGANKRLMIVGRVQVKSGDDTVYDYSAVYYPEGLISADSTFFFNHEQIDQLFFIGFQDPEEFAFREERLAPLGELYVDENGELAMRAPEGDAEE